MQFKTRKRSGPRAQLAASGAEIFVMPAWAGNVQGACSHSCVDGPENRQFRCPALTVRSMKPESCSWRMLRRWTRLVFGNRPVILEFHQLMLHCSSVLELGLLARSSHITESSFRHVFQLIDALRSELFMVWNRNDRPAREFLSLFSTCRRLRGLRP